jgi:periplasmic copper chaperone A
MTQLFARALVGVSLLMGLPALAHDFKAGAITIDHPFARATTSMMTTGAAYMVLANTGPQADRLLSASTPVAEAVMLHMNVKKGAVVEMHHISTLDLPAGQTVALSPAGSFHLMLMGLTQPLKLGAMFPLVLVFEKAGETQVMVTVERAGSMGPALGKAH